jgi:hypothetical protein
MVFLIPLTATLSPALGPDTAAALELVMAAFSISD